MTCTLHVSFGEGLKGEGHVLGLLGRNVVCFEILNCRFWCFRMRASPDSRSAVNRRVLGSLAAAWNHSTAQKIPRNGQNHMIRFHACRRISNCIYTSYSSVLKGAGGFVGVVDRGTGMLQALNVSLPVLCGDQPGAQMLHFNRRQRPHRHEDLIVWLQSPRPGTFQKPCFVGSLCF